eukprot:TRINITY_DN3339_c0_g1_i1.p1 TRINITY_DN3339_c0_g1~~TRINITY_DN3339_c0_g1_i1.p1  ORF type:complete len:266 (-),score=47.44 TRINITY_DN3339_c0_g1_i1:1289-2086(-)
MEPPPGADDHLLCTEIGIISERLKDPKKGIQVKDRKSIFGLRTYPRCFVGTELVDWLYSRILGMDKRADAVKLAQQLLEGGLFRPIHRDQMGKPFRDAYVLYRFAADFEADGCSLEEEPSDVFGEKAVVSSDKLDDLLPQFKHPETGVKCQNRRAKLFFTYPDCFLGSEAVDWLVDNLNISRSVAVELGDKMLVMGFIERVNDKDKVFIDNPSAFYRFIMADDSGPPITPDTTLYSYKVLDIDLNTVDLANFRDQVVLVVNVASN